MQPIRLFDAERVQQPYLAAIRAAIGTVLDAGRYVLGPAVAQFEAEFADYCGLAHGVGVANGSDALELALRAVGVGAGSEVITVANAGGYATTAIRACGARALYADIDPHTLLIDPELLGPLFARRPKALIATHLYGRLAPVEALGKACAKHGVTLIEDCAQAHGARRGGRVAGSFGAIGCFSFYPTKNLGAIGDGGALVTADAALAARLKALRQYGWSRKYQVDHDGGRNSRLDELQAAVLRVKLPNLDVDNERRRAIARRYAAGFRQRAVTLPPDRGSDDDVVHLYVVRCARRAALRAHLTGLGIDSDVHYPLADHLQPAWRLPEPPSLPMTEEASGDVLSLPCHPALSTEEVERVIAAVCSFV